MPPAEEATDVPGPDLREPELETPHTGDPAVDEALDQLAAAAGLPLEEQVNTFDAVHRILQDRLADVDG